MIQLHLFFIVCDAIGGGFEAVTKCETKQDEPKVQGGQNDAVNGENSFDLNFFAILISLSIQMQLI